MALQERKLPDCHPPFAGLRWNRPSRVIAAHIAFFAICLCLEALDAVAVQRQSICVDDDVLQDCIAKVRGGAARTSIFALNNATLPFTIALAQKGAEGAMKDDKHLLAGLNVYKNTLTYKAVADTQGLPFKSAESVLGV